MNNFRKLLKKLEEIIENTTTEDIIYCADRDIKEEK